MQTDTLKINEYGNCDIRGGIPNGYVLLTGGDLAAYSRAGLESVPAFLGYRKSGRRYYPIISGALVTESQLEVFKRCRTKKDRLQLLNACLEVSHD